MVGNEESLFRPVSHGFYPATALLDSSIDLAFVMLCNEAIDIEQENDRRASNAARPKKGATGGR